MVGMKLPKEMQMKRDRSIFVMKRSCVASTWFEKKEQKKNNIQYGWHKQPKEFKRCESNFKGVATSAVGNRHRQKKVVKNEKPLEGEFGI